MIDPKRGATRLRVPVETWIQRIDDEYIRDFVRSGGSAVKFVSGSDNALSLAQEAVRASAVRDGYQFTLLRPDRLLPAGKRADIHMVDRLFFELTRGVNWSEWAAEEARAFFESRGVYLGSRRLSDLDGIAADNDRDARDLYSQYETYLATRVIKDHSLAVEFRSALTALSREQVVPGGMTPTTEAVLLDWLSGRTTPGAAAALKRIHIFGRIDRTNARHMLSSFCRWLPRSGRTGLCAVLDFRPYEHKRKTAAQRNKQTLERISEANARGAQQAELAAILAEGEAEPRVAYSQAAYMQMLQLLRRFIDEIDQFERFLLVVLTTPAFYDETSERNFIDYEALQTRIGLEVHDIVHANPIASLVHLEDPQ